MDVPFRYHITAIGAVWWAGGAVITWASVLCGGLAGPCGAKFIGMSVSYVEVTRLRFRGVATVRLAPNLGRKAVGNRAGHPPFASFGIASVLIAYFSGSLLRARPSAARMAGVAGGCPRAVKTKFELANLGPSMRHCGHL